MTLLPEELDQEDVSNNDSTVTYYRSIEIDELIEHVLLEVKNAIDEIEDQYPRDAISILKRLYDNL